MASAARRGEGEGEERACRSEERKRRRCLRGESEGRTFRTTPTTMKLILVLHPFLSFPFFSLFTCGNLETLPYLPRNLVAKLVLRGHVKRQRQRQPRDRIHKLGPSTCSFLLICPFSRFPLRLYLFPLSSSTSESPIAYRRPVKQNKLHVPRYTINLFGTGTTCSGRTRGCASMMMDMEEWSSCGRGRGCRGHGYENG